MYESLCELCFYPRSVVINNPPRKAVAENSGILSHLVIFLHNKYLLRQTFFATKIILLAAPANRSRQHRCHTPSLAFRILPPLFLFSFFFNRKKNSFHPPPPPASPFPPTPTPQMLTFSADLWRIIILCVTLFCTVAETAISEAHKLLLTGGVPTSLTLLFWRWL